MANIPMKSTSMGQLRVIRSLPNYLRHEFEERTRTRSELQQLYNKIGDQ